MPLKIPRQRAREPESPGVRGTVRVDPRTKNLTKRLRPGEIAVIDHQDIDKVSAEALLACRPAAVVNAASSISGRYPNLGPEILVEAGIPLIDNVGKDVMHDLREGQEVSVVGGDLLVGENVVASGTEFDLDIVQSAMAEARSGPGRPARGVRANTMEYLRRERDLLLDGVGVPDIRTDLDGPPRPRGGAWLPLQGRPADPAALHPRVPPGADRGRRRGGRAHRGRAEAGPHRR